MKMLKKSLSVMLVVVMLLTAAPLSGFVGMGWPEIDFPSFDFPEISLPELDFSNLFCTSAKAATSGTCGTNSTWTLDDSGTLTISGTGAMEDYYLTGSSPWFLSRDKIIRVVVKNGITRIGTLAFEYCESLIYVGLPNSLESIGVAAFSYCSALASITIPDNVKSIEMSAFFNDENLSSVNIGKGVTSIGQKAFCNTKLQIITIPNNVKSIAHSTFSDCTSLMSITIGSSVTQIEKNAFKNCTALESVTIPKSVLSIEEHAFSSCSSLKNLIFGSSIQSIGDSAFAGCKSLESVELPASVTSIGAGAFSGCTSLKNLVIGSGVTEIKSDAFWNCKSLTSVKIPDSVKTIGQFAFDSCSSLESVQLGTGLTNIGKAVFCLCSSLKNIYIPENVTTIRASAFAESGLELIMLPDSITNIEVSAFANCSSIEDVYYSGQRKQWNNITIGSSNDDLLEANFHFLFNMEDYMASVWTGIQDLSDSKTPESGQLNYLHDAFTPLCQIVVNALNTKENPEDPENPLPDYKFRTALAAWEGIQALSKPSAALDEFATKTDIYLAVVLDVFMDTLNSSDLYNCFDVDVKNTAVEYLDSLSSIANNAYKIKDFNLRFSKSRSDPEFVRQLKNMLNDMLKARKRDAKTVKFINDNYSLVADSLEYFDTAIDFIQTLVTMCKIAQMQESLKEVLQEIADHTTGLEDGIFMAAAIEKVNSAAENTFIAVMESIKKAEIDVGIQVSKKIIDTFVNNIKASFPAYAILSFGAELGFIASNTLFATEDTIVSYYTAVASAEFCKILNEAAIRQKSHYLNTGDATAVDANVYLDAERLFISGLKVDCNNAQKFYDVAYKKGLLNIISNFLNNGNANYTKVTESISEQKEYLEDLAANLECSWILSPAYLREDHPYEYQEFINKANIENKETVPYITTYQYYPNGKLDVAFNCLWTLNNYILFDGYEVFVKKNDEEFTLYETINDHIATHWITDYSFGEEESIVVKIRAFAENSEGEMVYSEFSKEFVIEKNIVAPVLSYSPNIALGDFILRAYAPSMEYSMEIDIYRRKDGDATAEKISTISHLLGICDGTFYRDTSATEGEVYYYSAVLVLSDGEKTYTSNPSTELAVQKTVKNNMSDFFHVKFKQEGSIVNLNRVGSSQEGIELTWGNIPDAEKIIVIKKHPFAVRHIVLAELDGAATSYFDTDVSSGETYEYNIVVFKNVDGVSAVAGTAEPQTVTIPEETRITWIIGKQYIVQYVPVGEAIEIPSFELDKNHTFSGWDSEIPAVAAAGNHTFTAKFTGSHTWDDGVVTTHPTTETEGIKTYTCSFCGEQKAESIPVSNAYTLGDIDNDGNITSSDARAALRAAVRLDVLNEAQQKAADVDKDGKITSSDARSILRCAVGLETLQES